MLQDPDVREFLEKEEVSIVQTEFHNLYLSLVKWNLQSTNTWTLNMHIGHLVPDSVLVCKPPNSDKYFSAFEIKEALPVVKSN